MSKFIIKIIEFFVKIFYKASIALFKWKIFWKPFFFSKKRFLTSIICLAAAKIFYIFYILSMWIGFVKIYYLIYYKKQPLEKIINVNWSVDLPINYKTYLSMAYYLIVLSPQFRILKTVKILKKLTLQPSKSFLKIFAKFFMWWVWVFFTSLPKNIFIFARVIITFLSNTEFKNFKSEEFIHRIVNLILEDFYQNIFILNITIPKNTEEISILKTFPLSIEEWKLIFEEILNEITTRGWRLLLIKNYVSSFDSVWTTFFCEKHEGINFFYNVFEPNCCFSLLCYKICDLSSADKIKNELSLNLNKPTFDEDKNQILKFLLKQNWNNMNFSQHLYFSTNDGIAIMCSFIDAICRGVIIYIPKNWKIK